MFYETNPPFKNKDLRMENEFYYFMKQDMKIIDYFVLFRMITKCRLFFPNYLLKQTFSTSSRLMQAKAEGDESKKKKLSDSLTVKTVNDYAIFKKPGSIYDPPYINKERPFPNYALLNIHLISYEYTGVHIFYKHAISLIKKLNIKINSAYAQPARAYNIKTYKPYSTTIDQDFKLQKYHRIIRVEGIKSTSVPILLESLQMNLPEGIELYLAEPKAEEDEFRYIPDLDVSELKKKMDEIGN